MLDSYTAERHPVFSSVNSDFISRMIEDFRGFTREFSPEKDKAAFDKAWAARANADDADVTEFLPHYAGSPIVLGEHGRRSGAKGKHGFEAKPGYHLAPQALPDGGDLWDALGPGFTLMDLCGDSTLSTGFASAAETLGVPLKVLTLQSGALRKVYGCSAILVRPDQFIAWVGWSAEPDAKSILARAIGQ